MVDVEIGELLEEDIQNDSKIPFENSTGLTKRDSAIELSNLANGPSTVLITTQDDLPPLVDGFRTLEINKNYIFTQPMTLTDPILFPAGWNGFITKTFFTSQQIFYAGGPDPLFNTRDETGNIISISDSITEPGIKSTVTTSSPHVLINDRFVNITGTSDPIYSKQSLKVTNITATTFDINVIFTSTDTGLFDSGYGAIQFRDFGVVNAATAAFMALVSSNSPTSSILFERFAIGGFLSPGFIVNARVISSSNAIFSTIFNGLMLQDCIAGSFTTTKFQALAPTPGIPLVTIIGSNTKRLGFVNCEFVAMDSTQVPVEINSDVTNADELLFQGSPDNGVATNYFDLGGLDQTNPQVIAKNNGDREDSMSSAQVGFTNVATPIIVTIATQDIPIIIGGSQFTSNNLERATATAAGQITNTTKRTQKYQITFSGLIEKTGGGSTDIGLLLIKNGNLTLADTFNIPHSVNTGIIQISATRSFEIAENDTIDIAVVNFSGTGTIAVSQANISYSQSF